MIYRSIVSHFIKNYDKTNDPVVRRSYGYLGGIIGIIINLCIFLIEFCIGLLVNSIAVTADAFHNLSDVASSIVTLLGFKIASKPADHEHPFGHGRYEYIASIIVSFIIIIVGIEFIKSSFSRIIHPEPIKFSIITFILVLISIPLKIYLSIFNRNIGKDINSSTLKASSQDAFNDVVILSGVALSLLAAKFIKYPIDGYIGFIVAIFITLSGLSLTKETLNPLLGEAPDTELVNSIKNEILSYDNISGVHDLIIHNYGPGRCMASLHAEVPSNISITKIHEIIDLAEKEISAKLNIFLVIHMDPINIDDSEIISLKTEVQKIINNYSYIKSMHDFRVVGEGDHKNLIFDIVLDSSKKIDNNFNNDLRNKLNNDIKKLNPFYESIITIDRDYTCI
ncbi:MAG: cation diffusion facilitator family transporter [Bacillota bacterium]|nr:cation diffusion facilitator family transporter [Bacillota bacterium]